MKQLISSLLEIDLSGLLPEMGTFLTWLKVAVVFAMLIGPMIMLICGILYLYKPAPQATYKRGYRTTYAMGSTEAWRYTQRLAGYLWMITGGVLGVVSLVAALITLFQAPMALVVAAVVVLLIQFVIVVAVTIYIAAAVRKHYDMDGNRRK